MSLCFRQDFGFGGTAFARVAGALHGIMVIAWMQHHQAVRSGLRE
jgi:hypothetical protein